MNIIFADDEATWPKEAIELLNSNFDALREFERTDRDIVRQYIERDHLKAYVPPANAYKAVHEEVTTARVFTRRRSLRFARAGSASSAEISLRTASVGASSRVTFLPASAISSSKRVERTIALLKGVARG